ncbi:MAG: hypothetical protein KF855_09425 [Acidobacteria bacterium]|nr:hypothetical protein [Acidobacteriota bacterium]
MKKISLPLFCVAVFLTFSAVSAQEISKPVLVDETGYDIHGEGLLARLDHFAVRLQNNNERGTILLFMNEDSIKNVFIYRFLQSYPATRRIGNLFKIISVYRPTNPGIEFWAGEAELDPALTVAPPKLDLRKQHSDGPVYFTGDLYQRMKIDGKWTMFSHSCPSTCIEVFSLGLLSELVEANSGSKAYFILRGQKSRIKDVISDLQKEAAEAGLAPDKMRFINAGSKRVNDNKNFVEVEAFIYNKETRSAKDFPYKLAEF